MTRTKSSRALLSVVLAVLMVAAFMPALTYSSFAATAKKATKVTKLNHTGAKVYGKVGSKYTLKYKLSPSKLTSAAQKTVWKSSDSKIVKVIATKGKHATVKVKGVGTAKVTVYTKSNTKAKATWTFKTKKAAETKTTLTGVTVSAPNAKDPAKEVKVGTELQASVAPTDAKDVTYQWYADGTEIKDATKAAFTVTSDQIGKTITVKATSQNTVESAKTAAVSAVTVAGTKIQKASVVGTTTTWADVTATSGKYPAPNVGDKLRALTYTDSTATDTTKDTVASDVSSTAATYQWYRVGGKDVKGNAVATAISGATSSTYTVTKDDAGYELRLVVTPKSGIKGMATDANGTTKTYDFNKVTASNVSVALKVGTDDATATNSFVGTTLSASVTPAAAASDVTYQWYSANGTKDSAISGATSATYTPTVAGTYKVKISLKQGESTWVLGTAEDFVPVSNKATKSVSATVVNQNAYDQNTGVVSTSNYLGNVLKVTDKGSDSTATVAWYLKDVKGADGKDIKVGDAVTYKIGDFTANTKKADGKDLTKADFIGKSVYAVVTGQAADYVGATATSKDFAVSATPSKLASIDVAIGSAQAGPLTPNTANTVKVTSGSVNATDGTTVTITLPSTVKADSKVTTQAANATVSVNVITISNVKTNDNITFTVDLDGDGNAYTPVTYTVDMSNVTRA